MYIPAFNRVHDQDRIAEFIRTYGFATIVSQEEGALCASHLPVLFDQASNGTVTLRSHMARANKQWQHFAAETEVLCIFSGPHAYISPSWYQNQHTVPTWNYSAVHVYGRAALVDEPALRQIVLDTTVKYESMMAKPWRLPLSESELEKMLKAVVGFSIEVRQLEAKFKLGQNRSKEDQEGMVRGLLSSSDATSRELGKFVLRESEQTQETSEQVWP